MQGRIIRGTTLIYYFQHQLWRKGDGLMKLKGSEAIVKVLLEQGVDTVFGYPGGAVIPLYDALYDAPLKNVLTAHEQGAIHAADGYARASGRTGVCILDFQLQTIFFRIHAQGAYLSTLLGKHTQYTRQ